MLIDHLPPVCSDDSDSMTISLCAHCNMGTCTVYLAAFPATNLAPSGNNSKTASMIHYGWVTLSGLYSSEYRNWSRSENVLQTVPTLIYENAS